MTRRVGWLVTIVAIGAWSVTVPVPAEAQAARDIGASSRASVEIAALDARARALASDMQTLTGELRVDAMAALLSTLLERQAVVDQEMRTMYELIGRGTATPRMMKRYEGMSPDGGGELSPPPVELTPEEREMTPGQMCAPTS